MPVARLSALVLAGGIRGARTNNAPSLGKNLQLLEDRPLTCLLKGEPVEHQFPFMLASRAHSW